MTGMGLELGDLLDVDSYETIRSEYRQRLLAHKAERRVEVGDLVSITFEDRETVRYQIQEMARVEQLRDARKLAHEIEVYGELLPDESSLAATLFIEIAQMDRIRSELDRLLGIDECVALEIGEPGATTTARARFDERQLEEDRISAVHYLRFPLSPEQREQFLGGATARISIDHPAYRETTELPAATRASLRRDLEGATPTLLDVGSVPRVAREDRVIARTDTVQLIEPVAKARAHHLIVEPVSATATLLGCDAALASELFETARRAAADLTERGIAVQIVASSEPEDGEPARIHVLSRDR